MKSVIFDLGAVLIEWDPALAFADVFTSRDAAEAWMARIGFARPDYYEESNVRPETGYKGGFEVPMAETGEDVRFVKTTARIDKPRR